MVQAEVAPDPSGEKGGSLVGSYDWFIRIRRESFGRHDIAWDLLLLLSDLNRVSCGNRTLQKFTYL